MINEQTVLMYIGLPLSLWLCLSGLAHTYPSGRGSHHGHQGNGSCRQRSTRRLETEESTCVCVCVCACFLTSLPWSLEWGPGTKACSGGWSGQHFPPGSRGLWPTGPFSCSSGERCSWLRNVSQILFFIYFTSQKTNNENKSEGEKNNCLSLRSEEITWSHFCCWVFHTCSYFDL